MSVWRVWNSLLSELQKDGVKASRIPAIEMLTDRSYMEEKKFIKAAVGILQKKKNFSPTYFVAWTQLSAKVHLF